MPQLSHLGVLKLSRNGAYFSTECTADTDGEGGERSVRRWVLPSIMQEDIRAISPGAIEALMASETTLEGEYLGNHPFSQLPVTLRSGRWGKYLQVGDDSTPKAERYTKSIPAYMDLSSHT